MTSKRLESILSSVPAATAQGEIYSKSILSRNVEEQIKENSNNIQYSRVVATIPQVLKDEIKKYTRENKGNTETVVILKALKSFGFNVDPQWLIDKRTLR